MRLWEDTPDFEEELDDDFLSRYTRAPSKSWDGSYFKPEATDEEDNLLPSLSTASVETEDIPRPLDTSKKRKVRTQPNAVAAKGTASTKSKRDERIGNDHGNG